MTALEGGVGALATSSGQAAQTDRAAEPRRERRAHRRRARRCTAAPTTSCTTRSRSWASRSASSTIPTTSTRGRRRSGRTRRRSTARASATRRATSSTSKASSGIAHDNGIPLVIDNTLASPYLVPAAAATAPTSSCTRRRSSSAGTARRSAGSSSTAASSTTSASGRFPDFTEPDPSYHGLVFSQLPEPLRPAQYILKARLQYQRDIGAAISPFNAFLFLQGLETLSLRMERHSQNALAVAKWLEARDEVEWVDVPRARSRARGTTRAKKYLPSGQGAILAFGIKGGLEAGREFIDSLELFSHLANVGDVRSLAIHPASTTHQQLDARRAGHDRGDARPRAAVGRHRDDRRHPRRPRSRVPRRQGRLTRVGCREPTSPMRDSRHRRVAPGRSARPPPVRRRVRRRRLVAREPAGGSSA